MQIFGVIFNCPQNKVLTLDFYASLLQDQVSVLSLSILHLALKVQSMSYYLL